MLEERAAAEERVAAEEHVAAEASVAAEERVEAEASVVDRSFVLLTCSHQVGPRYGVISERTGAGACGCTMKGG